MAFQTEVVLEHIEIAALYLRGLIDRGIPMDAAITLTSSYISGRMMADRFKEKPDQPWQDPESA